MKDHPHSAININHNGISANDGTERLFKEGSDGTQDSKNQVNIENN